ncbi:MAG: low molecular weight phosphotyrosine protein phosphatase [Oscillospiraceae bacterium]|nr:low molecular weight phosphotyrosine protein phosphatase [Oscillospiraceae bacterium]
MYKILMVCHGNICRSPMAEFVLRDMLKKRGIDGVEVASAATSTEEIGNGVHRGTRTVLHSLGIDCSFKRARQMTRSDYKEYDLLLGADSRNIVNMNRIACSDPENKIMRLMDFTPRPRDISDPWYTGDFDTTYADVKEGCECLIAWLTEKGIIS